MSTYRDLDLSFSAHPVTGDVVMKNDVPAVLQSIRNLILTDVGEILWDPAIGGGVSKLLFEPNDTMLQMQLYDKVKITIERFEPRVEVVDIAISKFNNNYGIYLKITFYILNNSEPITETIAIKRLR